METFEAKAKAKWPTPGGQQQFVMRLPLVSENSAAWETQAERERVILDAETEELVSAVPGARASVRWQPNEYAARSRLSEPALRL